MYDVCDVMRASYCSADVSNHVLREYGEGSMGRGIRKFAVNMLDAGFKKGYEQGYEVGARHSYPIGFKYGMATSAVLIFGTTSILGLGAWVTKKFLDNKRVKKENTYNESEENIDNGEK